MTVESTVRSQTFSGGQSVLTFNFRTIYNQPSYINVNLVSLSGGTITPLVYNVGYTVSVNSSGVGGTVTVSPTYSTAYNYVVYRLTPLTQTSAYSDYNAFPASTVENDFDQAILIDQENSDDYSRSLQVPIGTTPTISTVLPIPAAQELIGWDVTGTILTNYEPATLSFIAVSSASTLGTSDGVVPTQHAVKTYVDTLVSNVKYYGATGNGSTDDTASIQSAINSVSSGGLVFFPSGTYKINATGLVIPSTSSNVILQGVVKGDFNATGSVLSATAGDTLISIGNGSSGVFFRSLTMANCAKAIQIAPGNLVSNLELIDVSFNNISNRAISVEDTTKSIGVVSGTMTRCFFNNVLNGLYVVQNAMINNFVIQGLESINPPNGGYQIYLGGMDGAFYNTNIAIKDSLFEGTSTTTSIPIYIGGLTYAVTLDNINFADYGTSSTQEYITLGGAATNGSGCQLLTIKNCNVTNTRGAIINATAFNAAFSTLPNIVLINNSFTSATGSPIITSASSIGSLVSIGNQYTSNVTMPSPVSFISLGDYPFSTGLPTTGTTFIGNLNAGIDAVNGARITKKRIVTGQAISNTASTGVFTASNIVKNGLYNQTISASTITLDNGANITAAVSSSSSQIVVGDCIPFVVINSSPGTVTVLGSTGTTLANSMSVLTLQSRTFYAVNTGTNAYTIF